MKERIIRRRRGSITRLTLAVSSCVRPEATTEKLTASPPPEMSPVTGLHFLARIVIRLTMVRISSIVITISRMVNSYENCYLGLVETMFSLIWFVSDSVEIHEYIVFGQSHGLLLFCLVASVIRISFATEAVLIM